MQSSVFLHMPNNTQRRHVLTGSPSALDNSLLFAGLDGCSFRIFAMVKRLVAGALSDLSQHFCNSLINRSGRVHFATVRCIFDRLLSVSWSVPQRLWALGSWVGSAGVFGGGSTGCGFRIGGRNWLSMKEPKSNSLIHPVKVLTLQRVPVRCAVRGISWLNNSTVALWIAWRM